MPIEIEYEPNDIYVLRISGTLKQSEFAAEQADIARRIDSGSKPRVLVIGEKFEGWERGADWNDLDFMISHGGEIAKIAIVAEPRWEVQALAFAGAGVRRAPVKFFSARRAFCRTRVVDWIRCGFRHKPPPQRYCQAIPTASKSWWR